MITPLSFYLVLICLLTYGWLWHDEPCKPRADEKTEKAPVAKPPAPASHAKPETKSKP